MSENCSKGLAVESVGTRRRSNACPAGYWPGGAGPSGTAIAVPDDELGQMGHLRQERRECIAETSLGQGDEVQQLFHEGAPGEIGGRLHSEQGMGFGCRDQEKTINLTVACRPI
ncbi:hypothetical protein [Glutamicibacter sp. TV12E]|uniref:hypothetical protein n=1 Tax=Glutamicibacter sp. TV12E TaxID=3446362 RepID=UPI0040348838